MVAGGDCLARIDGKAVFVSGALPGETVELEIIREKKDYALARTLRILTPSPQRRSPPCPLAGTCGGCPWQHIDDDYQRELRRSLVQDALTRAGHPALESIAVQYGEPFGYHSRFQFHRTPDGKPGLSSADSRSIVALDDCPVAAGPIREALRSGDLETPMARWRGPRFPVFSDGTALVTGAGPTLASVVVQGVPLVFDVRGFFQSNLPLLDRLVSSLSAHRTSGGRLLGFYAGVGTFSATAGRDRDECVLVEHNGPALDLAARNLAGRSFRLCCTDDERWAVQKEASLEYDTAIIDPPRQGISRSAMDWITASKIADLRYVSCDASTFARDAVRLAQGGFRLKELTLFDFYPQTAHTETLGVFER